MPRIGQNDRRRVLYKCEPYNVYHSICREYVMCILNLFSYQFFGPQQDNEMVTNRLKRDFRASVSGNSFVDGIKFV